MYFPLFFFSLLASALAQYPPFSNLTTIKSPVDGNITISYKSPPTGTCQTVFDNQQQYTGWVNIPGNYSTNTFFWFIAARDPTSQLTIWLNGGPGSSSMIGLFAENGPCEVVELAEGKFGTQARDWGWDRASNILYIDQVRTLFAHVTCRLCCMIVRDLRSIIHCSFIHLQDTLLIYMRLSIVNLTEQLLMNHSRIK